MNISNVVRTERTMERSTSIPHITFYYSTVLVVMSCFLISLLLNERPQVLFLFLYTVEKRKKGIEYVRLGAHIGYGQLHIYYQSR